jgi:hypothetical protein
LSGSVTYSTGGNIPPFLNASLTYVFTAPGNYAITATYNGDSNYAKSTSSAQNIAVQYPPPTVVLNPYSQTVSYDGTATVTALVDTTNKTVHPTGTVTFNGTSAGSVACASATDASGNFACQATGTFKVTSSSSIQVSYSGDANYPSSYSWASITMPDFMFNASGWIQLSAGQSQTLTVTFTSVNGLSGTVSTLGCSGLPAETTCAFNPAQVTLPSNGSVSTTLTVATTALGQSRKAASKARAISALTWPITAPLMLLGACLVGLRFPRRRARRVVAASTLMGLALVLLSCGGGSSGGGGGGGINNPVPSITALSPTQIAAGSQVQILLVNGTNFMSTSMVTYNGTLHNSSMQSPTQMQVALGPTDVAATGSYPVVVTNPGPGGGPSAPMNFSIVTGTPTGTFTGNISATVGLITHTSQLSFQIQ